MRQEDRLNNGAISVLITGRFCHLMVEVRYRCSSAVFAIYVATEGSQNRSVILDNCMPRSNIAQHGQLPERRVLSEDRGT